MSRIPLFLFFLFLAIAAAGCAVDEGDGAEDPSGADDAAQGSGPGSTGQGGATNGSGSGSSGVGGGGDDCPPDVHCVTSFPFTHAGSTAGAVSDRFDLYSCGSQDESGPEVIYRVDVQSDGFLIVNLPESGMGAGVDVDVHLLGSLDGDDCLDRGHWDVGELVAAGQYYVTADSWVPEGGQAAAGDYVIEIGLVTVADLESWGMASAVAFDALHAFDRAWTGGEVDTTAYAVVDFSLHASERRMWVFDVFEASLLHHTFTTVGAQSDPDADGWADIFSNVSGSNRSSLGLMKGAELYMGTYGRSMRMDGLELGYNHNVRDRAIVVHEWDGSTQAYVSTHATGAAPTLGCLGIDPAIVDDLRGFLSDGGLLLSHFPDGDWSEHSGYLP